MQEEKTVSKSIRPKQQTIAYGHTKSDTKKRQMLSASSLKPSFQAVSADSCWH